VWRRARPCESHTHESYDPNKSDESDESDEPREPNESCDSDESDESDESGQPIARARVDGTTAGYDCP
jgi:hypothetical protein